MQNLLTLCTSAACDSERAYVGTIVGGGEVVKEQSHKWHNQEYVEHTKAETYLPYALGGGYILSLDVVKVCPSAEVLWCVHYFHLGSNLKIIAAYTKARPFL
jgi:hypothetical protein